jgi:hypothetical protein
LITTKIESPVDNPQCISNSGDSEALNFSRMGDGSLLRHSDMLSYMRRSRPPQVVHSDGFLSFGGSEGMRCVCGFSAMILDEGRCPKCGEVI